MKKFRVGEKVKIVDDHWNGVTLLPRRNVENRRVGATGFITGFAHGFDEKVVFIRHVNSTVFAPYFTTELEAMSPFCPIRTRNAINHAFSFRNYVSFGEALHVAMHGGRQIRRGRKPCLSYRGIQNPRKALELACLDVQVAYESDEWFDFLATVGLELRAYVDQH